MHPESSPEPKIMTVTYRRGSRGVCTSNIIFPNKWPMRAGRFPVDHPCFTNEKPSICGHEKLQPAMDGLAKFRSRGYWASCFPEGDGITFRHEDEDKPATEVIQDIRECFGWEVRYDKGF